MFKKFLVSLTFLILVMTLLAACGDNTATPNQNPANPAAAASPTPTTPTAPQTTTAPTTAAPQTTATSQTTARMTAASRGEVPIQTVAPIPVTPGNTTGAGSQGSLPAPLKTAIETDLQKNQGVDLSKIDYTSIEQTEWPDGSLGCGKPGVMYMQVLTSGYKVLVLDKAKSITYEYHTDDGKQVVFCRKG